MVLSVAFFVLYFVKLTYSVSVEEKTLKNYAMHTERRKRLAPLPSSHATKQPGGNNQRQQRFHILSV